MKYLIIYLEVEHLLNFLSQSEKGDLLDVLIKYAKDEIEPNIENKNVLNVFNFLRSRLDEQFAKAKLKAETARANGATGGRPSKKKTKKNPVETQKNPTKPNGFIAPTLEEVKNYCKERNNTVNPQKFFDYYTASNWKDKDEKQVKNWKQKVISWEGRNGGNNSQSDNTNICQAINNLIGKDWIVKVEAQEEKAIISISQENWQKMKGLDENIKKQISKKLSDELKTISIKQKYID